MLGLSEAKGRSVDAFVGHFRHLDLFSGIGGFALAAEAAGWNTVGFAEVDDYASRVLKRHWPDAPNYGDVRNVPATPVELVTGGFPCQPFSLVGKRAGTADDRYLWPEMLAVVRRCRPAWVLGENVPGIVNMALEQVCIDLEGEGYAVWPLVIPACAVGAWHRRDRVWIVAYDGRDRDRRPDGAGWRERQQGEDVPHSWERTWQSDVLWKSEPEVGRVVHGVSNGTHRMRRLGNAIVPQVAYPLLRWMREGLCEANDKVRV